MVNKQTESFLSLLNSLIEKNRQYDIGSSNEVDAEFYSRYPFDIGLHAAADEGRTEDATEHRKQKAREEEGRVFSSQEFPQSAVVLATFSTLALMSVYYFKLLKSVFIKYLENPEKIVINNANIIPLIRDLAIVMVKFILPLGGVAVIAAIMATMLQTGFHISTKSLKVDFKRIIPSLENLKKRTIFSRTQFINSIKMVLKVAIIVTVAYLLIKFSFKDIMRLINVALPEALSFTAWFVYKMIVIFSVIFLFLGIPDYYVQKMEFEESLKMTQQEVKQESKELEGNPEVKRRQRERAREYASRTMMAEIKNADVVITNPTHFACAVQYVPGKTHAPKLVAKGVDFVAQKIKEVASEHDIPLVENVPLARGIYRSVEVNEYIPPEFFGAVAEILSQLDKFKNLAA